jgi:mannose-6-phosphate isomerase-like protein (cupin superfamily)
LRFRGLTGRLVSHPQGLLAIDCGTSTASSADLYVHRASEEYHILLKGQLDFRVADVGLTLRENELLVLRPGTPHAVLGTRADIEHLMIRAPAMEDAFTIGTIGGSLPAAHEEARFVSGPWGQRIVLDLPQNKNCWLIGAGSAVYQSQHLILAYLDFPTAESANADIGARNQLHLHQRSWEYYAVIEGAKTLMVDHSLVEVRAGEILEVPPGVAHVVQRRDVPFRGITMRVPIELNDKVTLDS